jgi:hypothetical protein
MKIILEKCKFEHTKTFEQIKTLGNAILNAQQVVHTSLSITLHHSTRSFQFINIYEQQDRAFVLLPQKNL